MRNFLACALLMLSTPAGAYVFIENYADWQQMSREMKAFYVVGVWDRGANLSPVDAGPYDEALHEGFKMCALVIGLNADTLIRAVDTYYRDRADERNQPPFIVLTKAMIRECEPQINQARRQRGLKPLNLRR